MQKIKNRMLLGVVTWFLFIPAVLPAQNIFWLESEFDAPRLVKSDTSGNELLAQDLTAGSLPQSMVLNNTDNTLLWTSLAFNKAQLRRISSDFNSNTLLLDGHSVLRGLAIDQNNETIFWISSNLIEGPKIWRATSDGQSATVLVDFGPASNSTPRAIILDGAKMYWTNFTEGKIQRADTIAPSIPEDLISGLNGPSGLAIDPFSARIFWAEMNGHQIKSSDMDGNNITLLVNNLSYPNHISINHDLNKMVWAETGTGKIKSADLDGSNIFEYKVSAVAPTGVIFEPPVAQEISGNLHIIPSDTTIQIHNYLKYQAQIIDSNDVIYPTQADWNVKRDRVGPVNDDGLLFSYFPGYSKIMAKKDSMAAKAKLTVKDTTDDSSGINRVKVFIKLFDRRFGPIRTIKEGEMYPFAGIPFPLNIFQRSMFYFPKGSLHEDISIEIELPPFCNIKKDSVEFVNRIVNAIKLNVFVGDSLAEPYYFDKPVSVSIPYRRGIVRKLGIDPTRLSLFYATDSTTFDSLGISHVMVDSNDTRIYALVEHFSSLVIREREVNAVTTSYQETRDIPANFELKQNFPNPFNPTTMIHYHLPKNSKVNLSIYNLLGQKVATLVNKTQSAGTYSIEWDASGFASGVYIYTLESNTGFRQSKKLVLIR